MAKKATKAVTWAAICATAVAGFEGCRQYVYRDPVGIPTYCFGETKDPEWGRQYHMDECKALLASRLEEFSQGVDTCVRAEMGPYRRAGVVSMAYNVGIGAFCKSTLVKRLNAGDPNACEEMSKWTRARGVELPGLVKRRAAERDLCEKNYG